MSRLNDVGGLIEQRAINKLNQKMLTHWLLLLIVAIAFWMRWPAVFQNRLHTDEALFALWSRLIAYGQDVMLVEQAVDKPPLLFYLPSLFYPLLGYVTWVARLPNLIASLLTICLTARLGYQLSASHVTALLAAAIVAFSPYSIQFSATLFTDPLMLMFSIAALVAATGRFPSPFNSGLLLGLALLTKYQALFFLPLLLGIGYVGEWERRGWLRFMVAFGAGVLLLIGWDWLRSGEWTLWSAQLGSFGGIRLIRSWELWPRLLQWLQRGGLLFGNGWLSGGAACLTASWLFQWRKSKIPLTGWLLWLFVGGYLLFHWLVAIPTWDRYLLPIAPIMALMAAWSVTALWRQLKTYGIPERGLKSAFVLLALFLGLMMLRPALLARQGAFDIGSTPRVDGGAAELAEYLDSAPWGTVLYDHWYSWQWRYYFLNRPVFVKWYADNQQLQADLVAFGHDGTQRYLAWPADRRIDEISMRLNPIGFQLTWVAQFDTIVLYQITPQKAGASAEEHR